VVLALADHSIDRDDHVHIVLRALTVVGNGELVGGVDGEVRRWPGGRRGHRGGGGGLLCASRVLCLLGGHGVFVVVPDPVVVPDLIVVDVVVAVGGALFGRGGGNIL
jgi:hypothetical protein